jgi:hypothetical protein
VISDTPAINTRDIERTINALHRCGDLFEIRLILQGTHPTKSGPAHNAIARTFSDAETAAHEIETYERSHTTGDEQTRGCYVTLNSLKRAIAPMDKWSDGAMAADTDIARRRWLLIDFDSTRLAESNATDQELSAALIMRDQTERELKADGWASPIAGMTGNGGALLYPIDLPANDESLISDVIKALADRFNGARASIDLTVSNAARITKLYGTTPRKAGHTTQRPQRLATLDRAPIRSAVVTLDQLLVLVPDHVPHTKRKTNTRAGNLPHAARLVIEGKAKAGSNAQSKLAQFINSLTGAGWSLDEIIATIQHYAGALDVAIDAKLIERATQAHADAQQWQAANESTGRRKAKAYAARALESLGTFGKGPAATKRQLIYLAACTIAARVGSVEAIALAVRDLGDRAGLTRMQAYTALKWLRDHNLIKLVWSGGIMIGRNGKAGRQSYANTYNLHALPKEIGNDLLHFSAKALRSVIDHSHSIPDVFLDKHRPEAVTQAMIFKRQWMIKHVGGKYPHEMIAGLGVSCYALWQALDVLPLMLSEIAQRSQLHVKTVRHGLRLLAKYNLAMDTGAGWIRHLQADLMEAARRRGTLGAASEIKERHAKDRSEFGKRGAKTILSYPTPARVREIAKIEVKQHDTSRG